MPAQVLTPSIHAQAAMDFPPNSNLRPEGETELSRRLCLALGMATQLALAVQHSDLAIESAGQSLLQALRLNGSRRAEIRFDNGALSPREQIILERIAGGLSNKEIARTLGISPETVKSHVKNIFIKLGVERRAQAVALAQIPRSSQPRLTGAPA